MKPEQKKKKENLQTENRSKKKIKKKVERHLKNTTAKERTKRFKNVQK